MKQIAMTTDYAGESQSTEEIYKTLKKIANAGFSHIHWCHEWDGDYTYSRAEMLQIRGWMRDLGLACKGVHATEGSRRNTDAPNRFYYRYHLQDRKDYTSENEYNRKAGVELVRNRMELAAVLGTDAIVLHMQLPYKSFEEEEGFKERYYRQVFRSLDELSEDCHRLGVRICVENMIGTPNDFQIEQFDRLFERYSKEEVGLCFDTGHGLISGEDSLEFARKYQDRFYMMHTDDNIGLRSEKCWTDAKEMSLSDEHRNPFSGKVDWEGFAKIVAGSPYELPIVMEVAKRDREEEEFLQESLEAGERLTDMILNFKGRGLNDSNN